MRVNIHEAKTHLSALLERVSSGEDITICRAGSPVARLTRVTTAAEPRTPGGFENMVINDDFDDPLPVEIMRAFTADAGPE